MNNLIEQNSELKILLDEVLHKNELSDTIDKHHSVLLNKVNCMYDKITEREEREKNLKIRNYYMGGHVYPFMRPVNHVIGMLTGTCETK